MEGARVGADNKKAAQSTGRLWLGARGVATHGADYAQRMARRMTTV